MNKKSIRKPWSAASIFAASLAFMVNTNSAEVESTQVEFHTSCSAQAQSIHHFARGIGAARSEQLNRAESEVAIILKLQQDMSSATLPYWREQVQVHLDSVTSWIKLARGDEAGALALASAAAEREDAVDKHPVTPGEVLPARELYADMLLETGDGGAALQQYRVVLGSSPNRLNALLGAAAAADEVGDSELAATYRATAREQTREGNRERKGMDRAWAGSP